MRQIPVIALLLILPALLFCREPGYVTITPEEARAKLETGEPLLLDVRTRGEYAAQHVPGSLLIPLNELTNRLDELADYKTRDVLVLCRSGNRSRAASGILTDAGFTSVFNIDGGIIGWAREGFPVEEGD